MRDHPRLRGNYLLCIFCVFLKRGSPPLTRELQRLYDTDFDNDRITPAYAGTTNRLSYNCLSYEDHPRLRGNYLLTVFLLIPSSGSPPLTRELLMQLYPSANIMGITPAYAGTTSLQQIWRR